LRVDRFSAETADAAAQQNLRLTQPPLQS
jgi:hypothetical protein